MPDTLNSVEERQLVEAVKEAVDLVDSKGMSPDDAIEKVATDYKFGRGRIEAMAFAYNTGRQTSQWNQSTNILDKLAGFDLADPAKIIAKIYGDKVDKHAQDRVHEEYDHPPDWLQHQHREKVARAPLPESPKPEPYAPDPMHALHKAYGLKDHVKQAVDELSRRAGASEDRVRRHVAELVTYFRKAAHDRAPFAHVEAVAKTYMGKNAAPLLDMVYKQAKLLEKRADDKLKTMPAYDTRLEPFTIIRDGIKAAEECSYARRMLVAGREKAASATEEAFRPFSKAGERKVQEPASAIWSEKAAGLLGTPAVGAMVGTMLGRTIGNVPKTKDDMIEDAWLDLEDPAHQNELRKIKAHSMLNSLMTDPEDPISGHDPDKVLAAFNEISQVAPRAAETAATLRPMLRRKLEGHQEPFEAKEMTDIEKGVAQTKAPTINTNILKDAPDSLMG